jgi:hypothetical protein
MPAQDLAVGDHDEQIRGGLNQGQDVFRAAERFGLIGRDAELDGGCLYRWRSEASTASGRPVRLGDDQDDIDALVLNEALQAGDGKGR